MAKGEPFRLRSKAYLQYVREAGCLVCRHPAQAHHLRFVELSGKSQKVGDQHTVPLCHGCHFELHGFGDERTWWGLKGIDPLRWAEERYEEWTRRKT